MKDFSADELNDKIRGFMARKINDHPELEDERYYFERRAPARRKHTIQTMLFGS